MLVMITYVCPIVTMILDQLLGQGKFYTDLNPIPAIKSIINIERVRFMYFMSLLLCFILTIYIYFDVRNKVKLQNNGERGTARLLTKEEFVDTVTTFDNNSRDIKIGGLIMCNDFKTTGEIKIDGKKIPTEEPDSKETYYVDTEDKHSLDVGTTRSGKTRRRVIPSIYSIARAKESMVINDLKGELFDITSGFLKEEGYDVIRLDFRYARDGNRYNFLSLIYDMVQNGDLSSAEELANDMAHALTYREKSTSSDPVWQRGEKSVIKGLIMLVAMFAKKEEAHMYSVYNNIVELGQTQVDDDGFEYCELNRLIAKLPPGHPVKKAFGTALVSPTNMRTSFFSSALANLELFADPSIAYLTGATDHDLKDIGRKPTAVFLTVPDEKETRHVMLSLYIDQMYTALVDLANENNGRLPNRVHCLLDEFGNMPQINSFGSKMTIAAGRGILFHLFVQDLGQLKQKYGDLESIIKGNCHNWVYLLTTDNKTSEEISKKVGSATIKDKSVSVSEGDKSSNSYKLDKRELLTPDEIQRFAVGEVLILRSRTQPYIGKLMDYSNYSFAKRMGTPLQLKKFDKSKPLPIYIGSTMDFIERNTNHRSNDVYKENSIHQYIEDNKSEEEAQWEKLIG